MSLALLDESPIAPPSQLGPHRRRDYEVLSPGTARCDRGEKLRLYAESGVREYWIVDPAERQIEFLINEDGRFVVALPVDREYRSPALAELRLDLEALWQGVADRLPRRSG